NNPFIEALPPIWSKERVIDMLQYYPEYQESHREWPAELRLHLIRNVLKFFEVIPIHIDLEQRLSAMVRLGYQARNPHLHDYYSNYYRDIDKKVEALLSRKPLISNLQSSAIALAVVGLSGVGKSVTLGHLLGLYPQVIFHHNHRGKDFSFVQLVWLKLECPFDGSTKGLCLNFFQALDDLFDTNYVENYARHGRATTDEMIKGMARLASLHAIGVLVIDEIQHLSNAKSGGSEKMLSFFVELVNKIGMPVILVGTYKAMAMLNSEFRLARRSAGLGDFVWDSMRRDETWNILLESLWKFQYTQKECHLTPQLNRTLYDVSQGITDLAVKAYMLAQARAITRGDEAITPSLIRSVTHDSFRMARPILDALKSGNIQELYNVDDVLPVDIETLLRVITNNAKEPAPIQTKGSQGKDAPTPNKQETSSGQEPVSTTSPTQKATGVLPEQTEAKRADSLSALAVQGRESGVPVYDLLRQTGCLASDDQQPIGGGNR
ncbi:MAG: ATP-binding protein, partial [Ktedonobacteraceae bacterium]